MKVCVQTDRESPRQPMAEKLRTRIKGFLGQFRVIRRALRHPQVPWYAKAAAGCAVLYVFSPVQLIPNFIPIIGQMDDVLVVSLGMRFLKKSVPPSVLKECQNESGAPVIPAIPVIPVTDSLPN